MIRTILNILLVMLMLPRQANAQSGFPKVASGKLERIEDFSSKFIKSRTVDIWLPENYSESKKYAVLYMQDGQMLFDKNTTWNNQSWDVDDVATMMFDTGLADEFIVIGIWNGGLERHPDYFPEKAYNYLQEDEKIEISKQLKGAGIINSEGFRPKSDNYLKFIVSELKPYIDKHYSVHTDRGNTFIAGSSMGALISIYALCEYPLIFGGAACLSTHWIGTIPTTENPVPQAFIKYLASNLPKPGTHKIYFDCGNKTLDRFYPEIQKKVDSIMIKKGYNKDTWITKKFPGEDHSEISWNKRLHIPLKFLLAK